MGTKPQTIDVGEGMEMVIQDHLGGYIVGGDPATQFPVLWQWMIEAHECTRILDVGCGDGTALRTMRELGATYVCGIDGVKQDAPNIIQHDYERGPLTHFEGSEMGFDMVWCCEFVEHVEERFVRNFLETFKASRRFVLMTHGEPGQPGHHHVNNQPAEYWKGALASIGFEFDEQLTQLTRGFASANDSIWNHYRRAGLAFRRA